MSTTNCARAGVADNAASNAAVAMAFGVSASFADRVCCTLETGDNRFVRIGDAPAPHVGDISLVCFEVHRSRGRSIGRHNHSSDCVGRTRTRPPSDGA